MKIVMAWELGRNYGHVTKLASMAKAIARKHKKAEFIFVLQKPEVIFPFVSGLNYKLLQAPYHPPVRISDAKERGPSRLYSDDLRPCGHYSADVLSGLLKSWSDLYALIEPDLLIVNAAPTALIAAKEHSFKKVIFGGTYDVPARASPMPPLRYWEKNDPDMLLSREEEALDTLNAALKSIKMKPLKTYAETLNADAQYLAAFEELDHYPERDKIEGRENKYYGPFFTTETGEDVSWKKAASKRIFAYIRTNGGGFRECMEVLAHLPKDYDCIVSAPGISPQVKKQLENTAVRIIDGPVKLAPLLKNCDLGICHASFGISCAFIMNGVPQVLLPGHIEQFMFAKAVGRQKLGRGLAGRFGPKKVAEVMQIILKDPQYLEATKAFAKKYKGFKPENLADEIAEDLLKLLKTPAKKPAKTPALKKKA